MCHHWEVKTERDHLAGRQELSWNIAADLENETRGRQNEINFWWWHNKQMHFISFWWTHFLDHFWENIYKELLPRSCLDFAVRQLAAWRLYCIFKELCREQFQTMISRQLWPKLIVRLPVVKNEKCCQKSGVKTRPQIVPFKYIILHFSCSFATFPFECRLLALTNDFRVLLLLSTISSDSPAMQRSWPAHLFPLLSPLSRVLPIFPSFVPTFHGLPIFSLFHPPLLANPSLSV